MKKTEVKVFDAYSADEGYYVKEFGIKDYNLFDYHNQIVNKKGSVKSKYSSSNRPQIKPLEKDLITKYKYEFEKSEKEALSLLRNSTKKAKDLYDSCKRKECRYESMLIEEFLNNADEFDEVYDGDNWDCNFSPTGKCMYHYNNGEYECIFCGEPEERK